MEAINNLTTNQSNMFGTKDLDTTEKPSSGSKYISYGNSKLKINTITIKNSAKGNKQLIFDMETEPVTADGFTPEPGFSGKVGRVKFPGAYLDLSNTKYVQKFNLDIGIMADKLGVRADMDAITVPSTNPDGTPLSKEEIFDIYVAKITPLLTGKFAWWTVVAEEYRKNDGGIGLSYAFGRFGFIASLDEGEVHLKPFDITKSYNFRKLPDPANTTTNQLPF